MSAPAVPPLTRLGREGAFASTWKEFLDWLGRNLADGADPWLLYPFGLLGAGALPNLFGPVVYAAITDRGQCRYVGQSWDVGGRFARHAGVDGRQERWAYVLVCPLGGVPEGFLDRAEAVAALLCRPVEGHRHPRLR